MSRGPTSATHIHENGESSMIKKGQNYCEAEDKRKDLGKQLLKYGEHLLQLQNM